MHAKTLADKLWLNQPRVLHTNCHRVTRLGHLLVAPFLFITVAYLQSLQPAGCNDPTRTTVSRDRSGCDGGLWRSSALRGRTETNKKYEDFHRQHDERKDDRQAQNFASGACKTDLTVLHVATTGLPQTFAQVPGGKRILHGSLVMILSPLGLQM